MLVFFCSWKPHLGLFYELLSGQSGLYLRAAHSHMVTGPGPVLHQDHGVSTEQ